MIAVPFTFPAASVLYYAARMGECPLAGCRLVLQSLQQQTFEGERAKAMLAQSHRRRRSLMEEIAELKAQVVCAAAAADAHC